MTAVFLNETRSKLRRPVRIFVDAMSGMPSVVSGLFIYATLIIPLAKDSSLFSLQRLHGVTGPVGDDDADHLPGRRGSAPSGSRRTTRGRSGPRVVAGQGGLVGRLADGLLRGGHGRHLGHRPRSRRDRPAAVHRLRLQPHERQPVQRSPRVAPAVHLPVHPRTARHSRSPGASPGRWCSCCSSSCCSSSPASSAATAPRPGAARLVEAARRAHLPPTARTTDRSGPRALAKEPS